MKNMYMIRRQRGLGREEEFEAFDALGREFLVEHAPQLGEVLLEFFEQRFVVQDNVIVDLKIIAIFAIFLENRSYRVIMVILKRITEGNG